LKPPVFKKNGQMDKEIYQKKIKMSIDSL